MHAIHFGLLYSEARREGYDHWESLYFALGDAVGR
jgi:hypothetical protein